jgi:hypothetical protein
MSIDPVGITIGLVGLFAASLDVLDRISTAKAYGKDYQIFVAKIETERFRLLLWGQAIGLAPVELAADGICSQQHELLQDPRVNEKVCELLTWAIQLFEDSDTIRRRHNIDRALITILPRSQAPPVTAAASEHSWGKAGIQTRSTSTMVKMRWALSGKRKSEELLQNLRWFVDKLHELVPTSGIHPLGISKQSPATINNAFGLRRQSRTMQLRIENRKLESRVRRTRKHARRIAVCTHRKLHKIRVDER